VNSLYIGSNGSGALNLGGSGALHSLNTWYVGYNAGSTGTVTQTGGTWDLGGAAGNIGSSTGSVGSMTISGGVFTNAGSVNVGSSGTGSLTISGGTFNSSRLYIAADSGSTGLVSVVGSTASIQTTQFRSTAADTSAILRVTPDAGGVSTIHVHDDGTSNAGKCYIGSATVEVDFSNYDSTDDLTLITADTALTPPAGLTVLTDGWSAELSSVGNNVYLVNITGPPKGAVLVVR
jgi:T5SS/PEP-CTERM-associated repeat protein